MDIDGILSTQAIAANLSGQAMELDRGILAEILAYPGDSAKVASEVASSPVVTKQDRSGILGHSFAVEEIYNQIWVTPTEILAGYIADQKDYEISIWNAYVDASKEITDIHIDHETGTYLVHNTLPILLPPGGEDVHDLYILREGPATQATIYTYTVGGGEYTIEITGQRVIPFPYEPKWAHGVKISYNFSTVVTRAKTHKEQRRPLQHKMFREQSAQYVFLDYLESTKAQNTLAYGHGKVLGIPIYTEIIVPTSTLLGATVITTSTTLSELWNLQNLTDFILIIDSAGLYELKEIDSIGSSSITVTRAIEIACDKDTSLIYPIFLSSLESCKFTHHSGYNPEISEYQANFKELIHG